MTKKNYTYENKDGKKIRRTHIHYKTAEFAKTHFETVLKKVCGDQCGLDGLTGWYDSPYIPKQGEC